MAFFVWPPFPVFASGKNEGFFSWGSPKKWSCHPGGDKFPGKGLSTQPNPRYGPNMFSLDVVAW